MPRHQNVPPNGGIYRWVNDFDTPWIASPVIPESPNPFNDNNIFPWDPTAIREETEIERAYRLGLKPKVKWPYGSFWRCLRYLIRAFMSFQMVPDVGRR